MEIGGGSKYTITCLGLLDITGIKFNIGHHVLRVVDKKILPIIQEMYYR